MSAIDVFSAEMFVDGYHALFVQFRFLSLILRRLTPRVRACLLSQGRLTPSGAAILKIEAAATLLYPQVRTPTSESGYRQSDRT